MRATARSAGSTAEAEAGFLTFDRHWDLGWALLPYLLVGFAYAATLLTAGLNGRELLITTALVLASVGWHFWFVTLHGEWPERRLLPMAIYFVGLLALAIVLSARAEPFVLLVLGCFPMSFVALPGRWAYLGCLLTGTAVLLAIGWPRPGLALSAQLAGGTALAALIGFAIRRIEYEAVRRREAHAELDALTQELIRANHEKESLQQQLMAAAHQSGVATERARLARDFHDTLAQGLAGIGSQLETADELLTDEHPAQLRVRNALALSRSSLAEARRSVNALRPGPLSTNDLVGAIGDTVRTWQQQTGIPAHVEVTGEVRPTNVDCQTALLRFTQEGLANIARHANASQATVTVSSLGDQLMIDIFDDGVGFVLDELHPPNGDGGYGLQAARERLADLGGHLSIETAPGSGTTITATVTVPDLPPGAVR